MLERLDVRVPYLSACCGDEVAEAEYSMEEEVEVAHTVEGCEGSLVLEVGEMEAADRFQETDRHGKPIRNFRYRRHYYGVTVEAKVTCDGCTYSGDVVLSDEGGPPEPMY